MDDEFFAASYVDYYGRYGGIEVSLWENLFSVKTDTEYIAAIQKLAERRKVNLDVDFEVWDGVLISLLRRIKKENRICCLELHESDVDDVVGLITEIDEERGILTVETVNKIGKKDGTAYVDLNSVSDAYYDDDYSNKLEILADLR